MATNKKTQKLNNLLVIAHPDDEALFFSGLLLNYKRQKWTIVCVTDANADENGAKRKKDFVKSCKLLGIEKHYFLGLPDVFNQRLPIEDIVFKLATLFKNILFDQVYTHGILGEYGHPHHQDVSYAVHKLFFPKKVWSVSTNAFPKKLISLICPAV